MDTLTHKQAAVLRTLLEVAGKYQKAYCFPSQAHIIKLTARWQGIKVSKRSVNRILKHLEGVGFFERVRRHHRSSEGKLVFATTLYKLLGRAFNHVASLGRWASRFFGVYRMPKLAQYKATTARDLSFKDRLACNLGSGLSKGGAGGPPSSAKLSVPETADFFFQYIRQL